MKVITIDFDNTLQLYRDRGNEKPTYPNKALIKLIRQWATTGHQIYIVTARSPEESEDVELFIDKHNLPIKGVHYTSSSPKINTLLNLKSELHVDDDFQTTFDAMMNNINTMMPPIDEYNVENEKE